MMKIMKPGTRGKTIKFTKISDGNYRSYAYDGFGKMVHSYRVQKDDWRWLLLVDGLPSQHFRTMKAAVESATEIERGDQNEVS